MSSHAMPAGRGNGQRVVVTGLGPVSSIGIGVDAFAASLRRGTTGGAPITQFDTTGFPHIYANEVNDFRPEEILQRVDPDEWGRSSLFAAAAARLAVSDAGLDTSTIAPDRISTVMGTTSGESQVIESMTSAIHGGGLAAITAEHAARYPASRLAHAASTELGAAGESLTIATACSASNHAIGYAYDLISIGDADVVATGGADSVCRWAHAGFYRLGALAEHACTPFDKDRAGILTGEGGSALVLESLEHAQARGARIYAEVLGYSINCDAAHMVAPNRESIAACIRIAQARVRVKPGDVDYICAHGTGTPTNDVIEVQAIRDVFGEEVPPISSIKSMIGHTMGAASAFGAIACVVVVHQGFLPPNVGLKEQDPAILGAPTVGAEAVDATVRVAQNHGFAFGGNNAIVLFGALLTDHDAPVIAPQAATVPA